MTLLLRRLLPLACILALLALVAADGRVRADSALRSKYAGQAELSGELEFTLQLSPPIATPGDTLTLNLTLVNRSALTAVPELRILLPGSVGVNFTRLPPGTIYNVADNSLAWLPVVAPSGAREELVLQLPIAEADVQNPEQTITAVLRHNGREQSVSADFWIGVPPQAAIQLPALQVAVGQPVSLRANVTGPGPYTYTWDFGDGRQLDLAEPTIAYSRPGTYRITLFVSNPLGTTATSVFLTVAPQPAAAILLEDNTRAVNEVIQFDNSGGGQGPLAYTWAFGDGSTDSVASPLHMYTAPGQYAVRLIVQNAYGRAEALETIVIGLPPENADLIISPTATAGEQIFGQALSDITANSFTWDMGDGNVVDGEQIGYTYAVPGSYYVRLEAANEFGAVEVGQWVSVSPGAGTQQLFLPVMAAPGAFVAEETGTAVAAPFLDREPLVPFDEPLILPENQFPEEATRTEQLRWYINEARRIHNLPPLTAVAALDTAAQQHTDDMATFRYTGHRGADGSSPRERLLRYGYTGGYGGEATYWGHDDPRRAVEFWVNSAPHRVIILSPYVSDLGVGFTVDFGAPNVWYWTAEFGSPFLPAIVLSPTPGPTATPTITATATLVATVSPSPTPSPTLPASTPLPTATPTTTRRATATPQPTNTPLPLATLTPSPVPTNTPPFQPTSTATPPQPTNTPLPPPPPTNTPLPPPPTNTPPPPPPPTNTPPPPPPPTNTPPPPPPTNTPIPPTPTPIFQITPSPTP